LTREGNYSIPVPYLLGGFDLHATVVIVIASAFALHAVRILDLSVYHKMLRGAVEFGNDFEEHYMKQIFKLEKGMTQAITHFSRHEDAKIVVKNGKIKYEGNDHKNALMKIRQFYNFCILTLVILTIILFLITGHFGHPTYAIPVQK
jgi:hypothetical protein